MDGWIKAYRKLSTSKIWNMERYSKGQAFFDLVLMANFEPNTVYIRGVEIKLEKGQLARSMVNLSQKWHWNERTVGKFLITLNKMKMIHSKTTNVCTVITILNYTDYQNSTEQNTDQNTDQNTERVQTRIQTNKNVKEGKECKRRNTDFFTFLENFNARAGKKYQPTKGRMQKFQSRLKSYSLDEIVRASNTLLLSPFHTGKNNDSTWYATPDFLLRNDEQIDKWLNSTYQHKPVSKVDPLLQVARQHGIQIQT